MQSPASHCPVGCPASSSPNGPRPSSATTALSPNRSAIAAGSPNCHAVPLPTGAAAANARHDRPAPR